MGKIKSSTKEVFTTTDGENFTDIDKAKKHQMNISKQELSSELETFINQMFDLTSYDKINKLYDSQEEGDYEKASDLENKINDFIDNTMEPMGWIDEMNDLTKFLIGAYQAFGMEKLSDVFMFIDNMMDM